MHFFSFWQLGVTCKTCETSGSGPVCNTPNFPKSELGVVLKPPSFRQWQWYQQQQLSFRPTEGNWMYTETNGTLRGNRCKYSFYQSHRHALQTLWLRCSRCRLLVITRSETCHNMTSAAASQSCTSCQVHFWIIQWGGGGDSWTNNS